MLLAKSITGEYIAWQLIPTEPTITPKLAVAAMTNIGNEVAMMTIISVITS